MSFDLHIYHTTQPQTDEDAMDAYGAYLKRTDVSPYIEPSPKIAEFFSELTTLFPALEDLRDSDSEGSPWSVSPGASDSDVSIALCASASNEDVDAIINLVEKHGLVCFDLQSYDIVCAPDGIHISSES